VFAELTTVLGRGEAACVVLATTHGWTVLSDEKGRFRRVVEGRIGAGRLMGTADCLRPRDPGRANLNIGRGCR
jgi:hypothetical protein